MLNSTKPSSLLIVRDPYTRFVSLYWFRRRNLNVSETIFQRNLPHQAPDLHLQEGNKFKPWYEKDINDCIMDESDVECAFGPGTKMESLVVRTSRRNKSPNLSLNLPW